MFILVVPGIASSLDVNREELHGSCPIDIKATGIAGTTGINIFEYIYICV